MYAKLLYFVKYEKYQNIKLKIILCATSSELELNFVCPNSYEDLSKICRLWHCQKLHFGLSVMNVKAVRTIQF